MRFCKDGFLLDSASPLDVLLRADGVALCISNQKNGTRGETIHHHALPGNIACPVCALARRVHAVLGATADPTMPISALGRSSTSHVTAAMIRSGVRGAVTGLHLHTQGIRARGVGSHWIRAGGAMAMKLNGCDLITIIKQGRWTSLTFLTYIHNQIAHLGANITRRMATHVPFFGF